MNSTTFTHTESFLIASAQAGSHEALGELINRHYQRMYRVALRIVRNPSDAEDVVQDVSVIVMRKLGAFRGQSALSTWLTTITINAAVTSLRKKKRHVMSLEQVQDEQPACLQAAMAEGNHTASPEEVYAGEETREMIASSLNALPGLYRKPLELRLHQDLNIEEIADQLNIPAGTVKVQLFRGRKAIKQHIAARLRPAA